jgi:hypothetical protein
VLRGPSAPAGIKPARHLTARFDWKAPNHVSMKAALRQAAAGTAIPMWTRKQSTGGTTYTYSMVGRNPFVAQTTPSTTITTFVVPINVTNGAPGSQVFSDTAANPCDVANQSPETRLLNSPILKNRSYTWGGTSVSPVNTQITDAFQRANFAKYTINSGAVNPGYHVKLGFITARLVPLNAQLATNWPVVTGGCDTGVLEVDITRWDNFIQNTVIPFLVANDGFNTHDFVLFQVHNVVFTENSGATCCILGYHNAFGSPVQTYGVTDYDTTGFFPNSPDISVATHEVGEWMDDPVVDNPNSGNPTPAWGNIGQVSGCQTNLEVGDPLSGTTFPVTMGGFTYHAQELAFFSWFYHQSPSIGLHGWYSDQGTFTTFAAACS